MRHLLRGRNGGPKHPDSSLHSYHYAPHKKAGCCLDAREGGAKSPRPMDGPSQNHAIFDSPFHLLATIPLSQTGS
jgi:hypothetical protein